MRDVLRGVRVLDFCWVGAGALVTKLLAEQGAEVIKIESQARPDNLRLSPPYAPGADGLDRSGYFASRNNDKHSFALNMSLPKGQQLARELAAQCDLVTNNFRPGVMERWGLGYEELSRRNPSLIYLAMSMQGAYGPHCNYIGFGSTIAALGGLVHLSGQPNREPVGTGTHYPDHIPSPGHALVAVLAAIRRREKTGRGALIEVSQLEATVNMVAAAITAAATGSEPARTGNRSPIACPSGVFRCRGEDEWCALAARDERQWQALATTLDAGRLLDDARFASPEARRANEDELEQAIAELVRDRDRNELAESLQAVGVPAWPVLSSVDLLEDEQLREREFWRHLSHPVLGRIAAPAAPFRADAERTGPTRAAPLLGEHTRELARELLSLSDSEIDELEKEQVLW